MWMIPPFITKIIAVLFPPRCLGCNKEGFSLCAICLERSRKSLDTPTIFITSIYSFRDPLIKKAIHAIKYFHRRDLVEPLTTLLATELKSEFANPSPLVDNWILVPIPMPSLRKYIRGYNQAELITKALAKQCSIPINTTILTRLHSPKRQVITKTKNERLRNQHNSFKVTGDVRNMQIILVDDVTTTGATLIEARKALLQAGATTVRAVTLAH